MVTHCQFAVRSLATPRVRSHKPSLVMGRVAPRAGLRRHLARCNFLCHDNLSGDRHGGSSDHSLWRERGPDSGKAVPRKNLFGMTGSPDLFSAKAKGIVFGADPMPTNGSVMAIQWQADQAQQVVFPTQCARTTPRARN